MWDKLISLFKDTYSDDENYIAPLTEKREARRQQLASQAPQESQEVNNSGDKGTLIGYNYLKGMNDKDDEHSRRFINLNKLLRGKYDDGKIETTSGKSEEDIRRKNS